jgi:uncharacterized delta-60 repeat protein
MEVRNSCTMSLSLQILVNERESGGQLDLRSNRFPRILSRSTKTRNSGLALMATLALGLTACGGGNDAPTAPVPPPPPPPGTVIGPAGGTVTGPNGASVVIPAGALTTNTRINITVSSAGAPPLPGGFTPSGQMYSFTPHGAAFALPVTLTLPFDAAAVPAGQSPAFYKTINGETQWDKIVSATFGANNVSAQATAFSFAQILIEPLFRGDPVREWTFSDFRGRRMIRTELESGRQEGGVVERFREFGPVFESSDLLDHEIGTLDGGTIEPDGIADGQVFSTADGVTYGAFAEAPYGDRDLADSPAGAQTLLRQYQAFIKRSSDARLTFTLSGAFIDLRDDNLGFSRGPVLNPACTYDSEIVDTRDACQDLVRGQLMLLVDAYTHATSATSPGRKFYFVGGIATASGHRNLFGGGTRPVWNSRIPLWTNDDFRFDILPPANGLVLSLLGPRTFSIDLSGVALGEEFTLRSTVLVEATNRQGDNSIGEREAPSGAAAFLRDPIGIDGTSLVFSGLQPIANPVLVAPPDAPVEPAPCTPGPAPDPLAGVIEFDAANYLAGEISGTDVPILVTRSGGTRGAVTATIATADISATAGGDYEALNSSVFFADGDAEPRQVLVPILGDDLSDEPDETLTLRLSQPGGCVALGAQASATLTIRDEDIPAPPASFTVGGTVSGLVGTGLTLQDHRFESITPGNGVFTFSLPTQNGLPYSVIVLTQPGNPVQICTVANGSGTMSNANVTNVLVACAPPQAPAGLDPGFGGGTGKVSAAFGGDDTDMLLQPDGKVLMVGGSPTDFMLARYNPDGTLDQGFGTNGLVTTDFAGGADAAFGAALLGDGRIVVVGTARIGNNDDFALVRYEPDGSVDTSFGTQGKTTTDFFGTRDRAYAVAVFPDNSMVVVGETLLAVGSSTDFALARYTANGVLDTNFGGAGTGRTNTDIAERVDIAQNVVIESTGTILVSGTITMGTSPVLAHGAVARYSTAGILDGTFGAAGKLTIPNRSFGDGLALQDDGQIIVAGSAIVGLDTHFGVMRIRTSGEIDSTFGNGGVATAGFTTDDDYGRDVAIDGQGRILVSGQSSNLVIASANFAVARFTPDGVLDTSFDGDGMFTVDFFGASDSAENVAIQPDGRIVLGGFAVNGTAVRFGLARINP